MKTTYLRENRYLCYLLVIFILLSLYLSVYLFIYDSNGYCVSHYRFGELGWCSSGPGTFFPFPLESGPFQVTSSSDSIIDYLIYVLILETNLIYILPILSWLFTVVLLIYVILDYKKYIALKIE